MYAASWLVQLFQSTLPRGSDQGYMADGTSFDISIHAPSRERLIVSLILPDPFGFQSTLPRGSDLLVVMYWPSAL